MKNRLLAIAGLVAVCLLIMVGASIGGWYALSPPAADASRNSSGTMSAANGPYVTGTVINSALVNARLADIESEITNSADRSGRGGFLAAVRGIDGTVTAPAFSWTSETGSGLFRNGAGDVRFSLLGSAKTFWNATGFGVGAAAGTYALEVNGTTDNTGSLAIKNSLIANTQLQLGLNNGNGAAVAAINATAGTPTLGWKFFTQNAGVAVNGFSLPAAGGVTIGASGTAISASIRGTASWTPGSVAGNSTVSTTITVTGATTGSEAFCSGPIAGGGVMSFMCWISSANTCTLQWANPSAGGITPGAGTYSCRAFVP